MDANELLRADALVAHEVHRDGLKTATDFVPQLSLNAMKAPALASAGGIAALLGFFSANARTLSGTSGIDFFSTALIYFFFSVLCSVVTPALAYLAQYSYMLNWGTYTLHWERPFVRDKPFSTKFWAYLGTFFHLLAVILVCASIVLLMLGGWAFYKLALFAGHIAIPFAPFQPAA
jgi:hypothetical protein